MVEILDRTTETCVVVRFGGKVTGEEYKVFLDATDERLNAGGRVNMVADLSEFEFYGDFEAFKEDFHFGIKEYRELRRVAMVGDKKWIELLLKLMGPLTRAEERHFPAGQLQEAVDWACS